MQSASYPRAQQQIEDPSNPGNFRPIALTSCIGKVFTTVLKNRWLAYMLDNNYMDTCIQKAFINSIPGCTEQQCKLASIIQEAWKKHRSLSVCWLDYAYGSVHHQLIHFTLNNYHALKENPGANGKEVGKRAKTAVVMADAETRLEHAKRLQHQGELFRSVDGEAPSAWSSAVLSLPPEQSKFALNASQDTLPHNVNLARWRNLSAS